MTYYLRFWRIGVPLAVLCAVIGWWVAQDYEAQFEAEVLIAINQSPANDGSVPLSYESILLQSESVVLHSRSFLAGVAHELKLYSHPKIISSAEADQSSRQREAEAYLDEALHIEEVPGRRLLLLQVRTENPELSANIANQSAERFVRLRGNRQQTALENARQAAMRRAENLRLELRAAEERLFEDIEQFGQLNAGVSRASLNEELSRVKGEIQALSLRSDRFNQLDISEITTLEPDLTSLRIEQIQAKEEYDRLGETLGPRHPSRVEIMERIEALSAQMETFISSRRARIQAELSDAIARASILEGQIEAIEDDMRDAASTQFKESQLKRRVEVLGKQYASAVDEMTRLEDQPDIGALFRIVDKASPSLTPVFDLKPWFLYIGFGLGLMLGFFLFIIHDRFLDRVRSPGDIERKLGLRLLGVLPKSKKNVSRAVSKFDPQNPISEAAISIATRINGWNSSDDGFIIQVTSTRPGEGKSTSVLALASAFAGTQKRTLIIDADMRSPTFAIKDEIGFGLEGVLKKRSDLLVAIHRTRVPSLFVLPCRTTPENPAGLLGSENLGLILEELKGLFDIIVIDSPPVLGLADAPIIGMQSDMTLYAVEQNAISVDQIVASLDRLKDCGCRNFGAILTKFKPPVLGQQEMYRYVYGHEFYQYGRQDTSGSLLKWRRRSKKKISLTTGAGY